MPRYAARPGHGALGRSRRAAAPAPRVDGVTYLVIAVLLILAALALWLYLRNREKPAPRKAQDPFSSADDDAVRGTSGVDR